MSVCVQKGASAKPPFTRSIFGCSLTSHVSPSPHFNQDADLTLAPPGAPITVLGKFSIAAMGSKVAVQTENVRAIGATSSFSNGTYPEGSVIPVTVMFSVEVSRLCKLA